MTPRPTGERPVFRVETHIGPIGVVVGGAMVVAGSFLPWTSVSGIGSFSRGGLDGGDGWITAGAGAVVVVAGLMSFGAGSSARLVALVSSVVAGTIGVVELRDVQERIDSVESDLFVAQVGIGISVILSGAAVGDVASFFARPRETTSRTAPPATVRIGQHPRGPAGRWRRTSGPASVRRRRR